MSSYITLTGYLREVTDGSYYMDLEDGSYKVVRYRASAEHNVPINKLIALSVFVDRSGKAYVISDEMPNYTLISQAAGDPLLKKHIGIFRCIPLGTTPEKEAYWQDVADDAAIRVQNYYRYFSTNWDVEVHGYVIRYEGSTQPPAYAREPISEFIAAHDMQGFEPNYFHVWGGGSNSYCGLGDVNGNRSVTFINHSTTTCGVRTIKHELGHNFGLRHAGIHDGVDLKEYGDITDIMGSGQNKVAGMHSFHMVQMGWYDSREIMVVDQTKQILMAPIEMPYHGMHPEEYQHIVIKKAGFDDYYLSLRKTKGTRYPLDSRMDGVIYAHRIERDNKTKLYEEIKPNIFLRLNNGVVVQHLEYKDETARVNIIFSSDPLPVHLPMPTGFPVPMPSATITPAHTGAWYSPEFDRQGFDVYVRPDNKVSIVWYTYDDTGDGQPIWYMGYGTSNGSYVNFDELRITKSGTFNDPTTYEEVVVGSAQLYFLDNKRGVFNWNTENYGRGGIEVIPAMLSASDKDGLWYQADKDGSGFGLHFLEGDRCGAYWYNYDNNGRQRWWLMVGSLVGDTYELDISEYIGGRWMYYDDPDDMSAGSATLKSLPSGKLKFNYNLDSTTVKDTGELLLTRVF